MTKRGKSTFFSAVDAYDGGFGISSQTVLDLMGGNLYLGKVARAICIVCRIVVSAHQFLEAKRGWRREIVRGDASVAIDSWRRICFHHE